MHKFLSPFLLNIDESLIRNNVERTRVLFGLLVLWRYFTFLGSSVLSPEPDKYLLLTVTSLVASLCVTLGFLTKISLGYLLVFSLAFKSVLPGSLGDQIAMMLIWGMLIGGAGEKHSIDAYLASKGGWLKWIPLPLPGKYSERIAIARSFPLFLYWMVALNAMAYHFQDQFWLEGDVLQLLLTTPYITEYYSYLETWRNYHSLSFDWFMKISLVVQGFWELLLFPLFYIPIFRPFVVFQGLAFFVISTMTLNLGYLPYGELLLWFFIFGYFKPAKVPLTLFYDDKCGLCQRSVKVLAFFDVANKLSLKKLSEANGEAQDLFQSTNSIVSYDNRDLTAGYDVYIILSKKLILFWPLHPFLQLGRIANIGPKIYQWVATNRSKVTMCKITFEDSLKTSFKQYGNILPIVLIALGLTATVFLSNTLYVLSIHANLKDQVRSPIRSLKHASRLASFTPVKVFNKGDLSLGSTSFVMYQESNNRIKIVPYQDHLGGRLRYIKNEYAYFKMSLS